MATRTLERPRLARGPAGAKRQPSQEDIPDIKRRLENGVVLWLFFTKNRKPERRRFSVLLVRGLLVWGSGHHASSNVGFEGCLDLRDVREFREQGNSKEFERWPEELAQHGRNLSFVLVYGQEFKQRTLSLVAQNAEEYTICLKGLRHLVKEIKTGPYPLQQQKWLWNEFYSIQNNREWLTLKELKLWMPRINYKISNNSLRVKCQKIDSNVRLNFEAFHVLYHNMLHVNEIIHKHFGSIFPGNKEQVSLTEFQEFLRMEQKESIADDQTAVKTHLGSYLDNPAREAIVYLYKEEFLDYMFSPHNSIWDSSNDQVCQDMDQPLSHYWIASSHNTYLVGDQFSSESSCEAYVRCLRRGARCIELDCWDGPHGWPIIYHGYTLTSKIRFMDVLKAIRDNAWVASEYPLILSIENHCNLDQQRKMAAGFQEIFGEMLVTDFIDSNAIMMPSPNELRRRIILKHRKLPPTAGGAAGAGSSSDMYFDSSEGDLCNSVKNGILYLKEADSTEWCPHFFVLRDDTLYYSGQTPDEKDDGEWENTEKDGKETEQQVFNEELHFSEPWYHGNLADGKEEADILLRRYGRQYGNGLYLVRDRPPGTVDHAHYPYSVSFWHQNQSYHCRIEKENGKYMLGRAYHFDSLYELICHYQHAPLRSQRSGVEQMLVTAVPQPMSHAGKEWYHDDLSRGDAERALAQTNLLGAFLVRKRHLTHSADNSASLYTISFRSGDTIKHCRIKQEGRLFVMGELKFENLCDLINFYQRNPLYGKTILSNAVNDTMLHSLLASDGVPDTAGTGYIQLTSDGSSSGIYVVVSRLRVRAVYDYIAQRQDELTFCKGAIITEVQKEDDWWLGTYGHQRGKYFPANYVEDIESGADDTVAEEADPLGSIQKGTIDLKGVKIDTMKHDSDMYMFRIETANGEGRFLGVKSQPQAGLSAQDEAMDWVMKIRACGSNQGYNTSTLGREKAKKDLSLRIAKQLSDLIVYCQTIPFVTMKSGLAGKYYEMCSMPEGKGHALSSRQCYQDLLNFNCIQLSRVYPKGQRVDSSNYDPVPLWNCGCHMVALNYQTPDRAMQLNHGLFSQNGNCGYVLQPPCMRTSNYNPYDRYSLDDSVEPLTVSLTVIGARHLTKTGRGIASPFVEVEVIGAQFENRNKYKTKAKADNGFNPVWNESCDFDILNPGMALLRFVIQDEDIFGEPNFLGQATLPVNCIKTGYRSIQLKNGHSENLELASLLVHIQLTNLRLEDPDIYDSGVRLRERFEQLQLEVQQEELYASPDLAEARIRELVQAGTQLLQQSDNVRRKTMRRK